MLRELWPEATLSRTEARLLWILLLHPDADLVVRLTDVHPDGRSMLLTDGALRLASRGLRSHIEPLTPGEIVEGVVDLWSTSVVLAPGHRLRVSVTSSSWPRFAVNRSHGLDYPASVEGPGRPARVALHHAPPHASYLELPVPERDPETIVGCP